MTAATDTAAAAVTGITDQQLTALQAGRWDDDAHSIWPGWERAVGEEDEDGGVFQRLYLSTTDSGWTSQHASHAGVPSASQKISNFEGQLNWWNSLDEAVAECDKLAGGRKPAEEGSATKQEDRFAKMLAAS